MSKFPTLVVFFFLAISFKLTASECYYHPKRYRDKRVTELLRDGRVINILSMRDFLLEKDRKADFDGDVYLVNLDNGLKGVFKNVQPDDFGNTQAEVQLIKPHYT